MGYKYRLLNAVGPFSNEEIHVEADTAEELLELIGNAQEVIIKAGTRELYKAGRLGEGSRNAQAAPNRSAGQGSFNSGDNRRSGGGYDNRSGDYDKPVTGAYCFKLGAMGKRKLNDEQFNEARMFLRAEGFKMNKEDKLWYGNNMPDLTGFEYLQDRIVKQSAGNVAPVDYDSDDIPF